MSAPGKPAATHVHGADCRHEREEPIRRDAPKVGRNDACPCGSGRKLKKCHGASTGPARTQARP